MATEDIHQKLGKGYNEALTDMKQLYNYIAYVLQVSENAMDQYNRLRMLF